MRRRVLRVLKRTFAELRDDNLTDWAAALTYYGLLALFGHELNAELERAAEIEEGQPGAERETQLDPRVDPR